MKDLRIPNHVLALNGQKIRPSFSTKLVPLDFVEHDTKKYNLNIPKQSTENNHIYQNTSKI